MHKHWISFCNQLNVEHFSKGGNKGHIVYDIRKDITDFRCIKSKIITKCLISKLKSEKLELSSIASQGDYVWCCRSNLSETRKL